MIRSVLCSLFLLLLIGTAAAQDQASDLAASNVEVKTQTDVFGTEMQVAEGMLINNGTSAYTGISLSADVYDASGQVVGEGFGYLVNRCGAALVDYTLEPGTAWRFSVELDLYDASAQIDHVDITPSGTATAPDTATPVAYNGIATISREEVVSVEWIDATSLRYGVGCAGDVFTNLTWYQYDLNSGALYTITHPDAALVTDTFLQNSQLLLPAQGGDANPQLLDRSFLSFPPDARRPIFQNDIHTMYSVEPDGTFRRLIHDKLYRNTLQGIIWIPGGRFLAYYFGAYGEPVRYFTASVEGQMVSGTIDTVTPSVTVPGPAEGGEWAVISGTFDGVTGYYLKSTLYLDNHLLFQVDDLPGNNYPAPIYYQKDANTRYIYLIRPVDDVPRLQCFQRETGDLNDLTPVPLNLSTEDRAWSWLSPDASTLAISANGVHGGLWLVNLRGFMACQ